MAASLSYLSMLFLLPFKALNFLYFREIHFGREKSHKTYDRSASSDSYDITGNQSRIFFEIHPCNEFYKRYLRVVGLFFCMAYVSLRSLKIHMYFPK